MVLKILRLMARATWLASEEENITKKPKTGPSTLLSANVGEISGMRFLSNGGLVVADVGNGALLRIQPSGSSRVVLAGINYPNGVEVDKDDFVYVSEQNAGQVRRIHPYTGEYTIIAKGLFNPNGLSFFARLQDPLRKQFRGRHRS